MTEPGEGMVAFLGVPPDRRLFEQDMANLPEAERYREAPISTHEHDRLVAVGSVMTGGTLLAGAVAAAYGGWQMVSSDYSGLDVALLIIGIVLVATHWGWVHVAEYAGLTIDERKERGAEQRRADWLAGIEPYPRFSVATRVLEDASTVIERSLHQPVMTPQGTFTFERKVDGTSVHDAHTSAAVLAEDVETTRRAARLETDRQAELWHAASAAYDAALTGAHDDAERLAAQRAAATALSDHINKLLLEPPLVE